MGNSIIEVYLYNWRILFPNDSNKTQYYTGGAWHQTISQYNFFTFAPSMANQSIKNIFYIESIELSQQ